MKKSYLIAILILVISFLWIGSGVLFSEQAPAQEKQLENSHNDAVSELMKVRVMHSQAQEYQKKIHVNGRSQASKDVVLKAEAEGQIIDILVGEGETVTKGTEIIKIDVRERQERVREATELVKQKQIELNAAQKLIKRGYSSDVQVAQARSELESAKASLTRAQIALEKTVITAPFDGVLGVRDVDIGDYVSVGDPISTIVDLDPLKVQIFINEKEVVQIHKDDKAEIRFSNGAVSQGHVRFISPTADEKSRTFQVNVEIPNKDNLLPSGLTAAVTLETETHKAHQISPAILTLNDAGDVGVKIVEQNNIIAFKPITVIADEKDYMWISGLPDSAKIVSVGQDFVIDGQEVNPIDEDK